MCFKTYQTYHHLPPARSQKMRPSGWATARELSLLQGTAEPRFPGWGFVRVLFFGSFFCISWWVTCANDTVLWLWRSSKLFPCGEALQESKKPMWSLRWTFETFFLFGNIRALLPVQGLHPRPLQELAKVRSALEGSKIRWHRWEDGRSHRFLVSLGQCLSQHVGQMLQ